MKDYFKKAKEIYNDPKGKAFLFFGFYFFFFLGISLLFRTNDLGSVSSVKKDDSLVSRRFSNQLINGHNYSYKYVITIDDIDYVYSGKKNGNRELFSYLNHEYYKSGSHCFCFNNTWKECEEPFLYPELLDLSLVFSLIDSASFESITSYESGKNSIRYLLPGVLIDKLVYQKNTDYADDGNSIIINTDENLEAYQIYLNFDSYGVINHLCNSNFRIRFEYDQFGKISKIVNPMD